MTLPAPRLDASSAAPPRPAPDRSRREWLRRSAALALAGAWSLPGRAADADAAVQTFDRDWVDTRRERPVPVRLYLPRARCARDPLPLVVFSHGIGGSRRGYSWLGRHFAGHGIASLHLQHVGSDRRLWGGNLFTLVGRLQAAAQEAEAMARALDLRFALDTLLDSEFAPCIDAGRIVAAGHSYGANTTLLVSGAHIEREGQPVALHDGRVRAAIVISAPPFYGEAEPLKILQTVTVPSLHVTCTGDTIRIPGYYSAADDRLAVFDAVGSTHKWLAVYEGGSHSMFTDRSGSGGALNPLAKAATQALSLAFLQAVLWGDTRALGDWPARHADILAHFAAVRA